MKRWTAAVAAGLVALGASVAAQPAQASSTAWRQVYQAPVVNAEFSGIAAVNRNDIWAVGRTRTAKGAPVFQPFVRHFDGSAWRAVTIPGGAGTTADWVAASAADNVWIGGLQKSAGISSYVFRWDGARWHRIRVPRAGYVGGIAVFTPTNVWILGNPGSGYSVFHWNGKVWQNYLSDSTTLFTPQSLSASSPKDVWVAGFAWSRSRMVAVAYHWNGRVWRRVALPTTTIQSGPSITAVSASDVWLGWGDGIRDQALHWDGRHWRRVPLAYLASTSKVVPTGTGGYWFGAQEILKGGTWTDLPAPALPGGGGYAGFVTRIPGTRSFLLTAGADDVGTRTSRATIFRFDL